ncbi:hypothetical protein HY994_04555 [Candidatus Micrarchaeota archaeon]|nr:hypothetical protein [Candidatus Micrarchaeota archaeon]
MKTDTEQKFREAAMKKHGYSKGSLKTALEEAIGDWLEKQNGQPTDSTNEKERQTKETTQTQKKTT